MTRRILPDDHPLANVLAVGPSSPAARRHLAEDVVGFTLGERVKVVDTVRRWGGRTGHVRTINPADIEVGIVFGEGSNDAPIWFTPKELVPAAERGDKSPRRPLLAPQPESLGAGTVQLELVAS